MEQLRLILLAGLGIVGLLIYQEWQQLQTPIAQPGVVSTPSPFAEGGPADRPPMPPVATADGDAPPSVPQLQTGSSPEVQSTEADAPMVWVRTDLYEARISLTGGDLRELRLLDYPRTNEEGSPPFHLLDEARDRFFVVQSGVVSTDGPAPLHTSRWTREGPMQVALGPQQEQLPVRLSWTDPSGRQVQRTYHFRRGSYTVEVSQTLSNQGDSAWTASPYWRFVRDSGTGGNNVPFVQTFNGVATYTLDDGKYKFRKHDLDDLLETAESTTQLGGWTCMLEHYFLAAVLPPAQENNSFYSRPSKLADYLTEYVAQPLQVDPGASAEHSVRLYLGPKLQNQLGKVAPGLELTIDYGLLTPISEPLFWVMDKFHDLTGNWGWSIILVTLLVKALFFKLSEKQYRSMARMKKFAPRIQQIKERYADDRQRLHQAMMDLYQKEGFNPLAGCWPMLVQFPVFIALYWVLIESVELRQADFVLWLNDLSAADPYFVLPVLFGISMFLQQKLSGQAMTMEPMQQKIMNIMPVAMTVFFAFFPSGLVLYWFVSNLIGIGQQWIITRRMEAAPSK
ncbi:MAG: membrane protein insertase YidC [Oceanococcaceae bacterium]